MKPKIIKHERRDFLYNRHFIMLKENNQSTNPEKHTAFGKCILETNNEKLKITLSVQYLNSECLYKIFIIYKKDISNIKGFFIGNINVDTKGKGEFKKEFENHKFLETEIADEFDALFIVAIKNNIKNVVLEGYKNEKFVWNKKFLTDISDKENTKLEDFKIETEIKAKQSFISENEKENESKKGNESKERNENKEEEKENIKDPKENLIMCNPPMIPFQRQNRNVDWVRINLEEINYLPVDYFEYISNPFILNAYKNYNHLVFGYVNDELGENYYLGIPEMYDSSFEKTAKNHGFMQFKCCDDTKAKDGEYGYWLLKIM